MYTVDDRDIVHPLSGIPQSSIGAPLPMLLSDEHSTLLSYVVQKHDSHWDGTATRVVGPESDDELIAIVQIKWCYALMFGPPNDEAFSGHPLQPRGLKPYAAFEVLQSSWIRSLERMNSVHPHHKPERFVELRHFVLSFHDSTFECVAAGISHVQSFRGSIRETMLRMAGLLLSSNH